MEVFIKNRRDDRKPVQSFSMLLYMFCFRVQLIFSIFIMGISQQVYKVISKLLFHNFKLISYMVGTVMGSQGQPETYVSDVRG